MLLPDHARIGYVVKRYPRYSETFIVNEILAHEKAGLQLDIFALRPPTDTHFQPGIAQVRAAVHYLSEQGKMADLWVALNRLERLMPGSISRLTTFGETPVRSLFQAAQLAIAIHERGLTHLHAHFATSAATIARIAATIAGITYSITAHAKDIFHESVDPDDLRIKLRDASSTITVSDYNAHFLNKNYGQDARRVIRIYNGLDLERFSYAEPRERSPLIVGIGRLVEKKGFPDLIAACTLLAKRGIPFTCQIIGAGEQENLLRTLIDEFSLSEYVQLLGPRPQSEIVSILHKAAVFAAPCVVGKDGNRDGLPTVLLESMALGTPCISTDVTGIPEILLHEQTGLLVSQEAPRELAEALERLLIEPSLRVSLATSARKLIEQRFDIHHNTKAIREQFVSRLREGDSLPTPNISLNNTL